MTCNHRYPGQWETHTSYNGWDDEYTVREVWVDGSESFVDVSLHSYKCVQCGQLFYYSKRGKISSNTGITLEDI